MSDDDAPFGRDDAGKPIAPHGFTATGKVKKDGRGRPTRGGAGARPAAPKPRPARPSSSGPARGKRNYKDAIKGMLHALALPMLPMPSMQLDAAAIILHADDVAEAFNTTAQTRPEIAAMCEKLMVVGPYGLLIGALIKPAAQIAVNHGIIPEAMAGTFGAVPPAQLGHQLAAMLHPTAPTPPPVPQQQHVNGYAAAAV